MYHRFNESEYPSTNIQMDIFKEHIQIIKKSNFNFHNPNKFKEQFSTIRLKKRYSLLLMMDFSPFTLKHGHI